MGKIYSSIQKLIFFRSYNASYLIPVVLFVCAFIIYSYHLEGQPWHGDEWLFNAGGVVYFDLLKKGDFFNPCWNGLEKCDLLFAYNPTWPVHSGHIRPILIGLSRDIVGAEEGNPLAWSHFYVNREGSGIIKEPGMPWKEEGENISVSDLVASRFLSTIFGSLTVTMAYFL